MRRAGPGTLTVKPSLSMDWRGYSWPPVRTAALPGQLLCQAARIPPTGEAKCSTAPATIPVNAINARDGHTPASLRECIHDPWCFLCVFVSSWCLFETLRRRKRNVGRRLKVRRHRFVQKLLAKAIVKIQTAPVRVLQGFHIIGQGRIGQEYRRHLFAVSIPQAQSPASSSGTPGTAPLKERDLSHRPHSSKLFRGASFMPGNAQMKVPRAKIDREVAIRDPHLRSFLEADLEDRALEAGADYDAPPVVNEDFLDRIQHGGFGRGEVAIGRHRIVRVPDNLIETWRRYGCRCHLEFPWITMLSTSVDLPCHSAGEVNC